MSGIDRRIKELTEDVVARMLKGNAADYVAYASLVARYRVLVELTDFLKENPQGDDLVHDEK